MMFELDSEADMHMSSSARQTIEKLVSYANFPSKTMVFIAFLWMSLVIEHFFLSGEIKGQHKDMHGFHLIIK